MFKLKKILKEAVISILCEKAPPGKKYEDMVLRLKKQYGENSSSPFAIAWAKYNQDKKKKKKKKTNTDEAVAGFMVKEEQESGLNATWDQLLVEVDSEEEEQNATPSFDMHDFIEQLNLLKTQKERLSLAMRQLEKLGEGEGRVVFKLDDGNVLKLAKDKFGLAQNRNEALTYEGLESNDIEDIVTQIYSNGPGYSFLVSEYARPATDGDFVSKTGMNFDYFSTELEEVYRAYKARIFDPSQDTSYSKTDLEQEGSFSSRSEYENWRTDEDGNIIETEGEEIVEVPEFIIKMIDVVSFGDLLIGDLMAIEHYGVTNDGRLVLIDSGLSSHSTWQR
jgi:hypothetical protein